MASDAATTATNLATVINNLSTQTGVTATDDGGGEITLSNTNGDAIELATATGGAADLTTLVTTDNADDIVAAGGTIYSGILLASEVRDTDFTYAGTLVDSDGTAITTANLSQANNTLSGVSVLTSSNANDALLTLDFALDQVNSLRAELGATQIRFEATISNLQVSSENLSAARSRIRDADFAAETAELTRTQILQQAGIAILSQANAAPQNVLALLQ